VARRVERPGRAAIAARPARSSLNDPPCAGVPVPASGRHLPQRTVRPVMDRLGVTSLHDIVHRDEEPVLHDVDREGRASRRARRNRAT